MAAGKIISKILGIGNTVIDRMLPDKVKNAEFKHEFRMELLKNDQTIKMAAIEDVKDARGLAGTELREIKNIFIDTLRALPRPLLALTAGAIWVYSIIQRVDPDIPHLELNYYDYGILASVIAFYFGGRIKERIDERRGKSLH